MSGNVKIRADLLHCRVWHQMPAKKAMKEFMRAARGEGGPLADYVQPWNGRLVQSEWAILRAEVFARDDYTCQYCGERGMRLECDHVMPLARGGSNDIANLVTACFKCNRSKRCKTVEEWLGAHPHN